MISTAQIKTDIDGLLSLATAIQTFAPNAPINNVVISLLTALDGNETGLAVIAAFANMLLPQQPAPTPQPAPSPAPTPAPAVGVGGQ